MMIYLEKSARSRLCRACGGTIEAKELHFRIVTWKDINHNHRVCWQNQLREMQRHTPEAFEPALFVKEAEEK
jgi:hypothetical protein